MVKFKVDPFDHGMENLDLGCGHGRTYAGTYAGIMQRTGNFVISTSPHFSVPSVIGSQTSSD